jgi:hypothetical protein
MIVSVFSIYNPQGGDGQGEGGKVAGEDEGENCRGEMRAALFGEGNRGNCNLIVKVYLSE